MLPGVVSPLASVKALAFDVLGTSVDWRTSIMDELELFANRKLSVSPDASDAPSEELRERLKYLNEHYDPKGSAYNSWTGRFASAWRSMYGQFVRSQARAGTQSTADAIDEHLYDSLLELLEEWLIDDLFDEDELRSLSLVWHRLAPWTDSAEGLIRLTAPPLGLITATLSNDSPAMVRVFDKSGKLNFQHHLHTESLGPYKHAPEAYLAAGRELGLQAEEVAMVTAHMADLEAARSAGMRTIYVEREDEENWQPKQLERARTWVDIWITKNEDGFVGLAKRLEELRGQSRGP